MPSILFNRLETQQRLGSSYTAYRLLLSLGLFAILLVTVQDLIIGARHPFIYAILSCCYVVLCAINFLTFKFYQKKQHLQLFIYLTIDVIHITAMLFLSSGPNIAIVLLYMMVVLAATMLLSPNKALFLTLTSIIAVVYQQFFYSIFDGENISFIGSSALITLVFLSTHFLGKVASKRMQFVEELAVDQRKEILQLQQIHQSIIEQLDTGFMVINDQGTVITFNESAKTLLNIPNDMLYPQQNLHDLCQDFYRELLVHSEQQLRGVFHYACNQDGTGLSIQYRPIATQKQQLTLLIIESLQKINQQVQQLKLASLGQLSASIAHEIRNPLAAISQANELLASTSAEEQRMLSQMIQKQCLRINRIIEDTLAMSKQQKTFAEHIPLQSWLSTFIHEDLTDIADSLYISCEEEISIYFDTEQLRQVLINLIRNAVRHGQAHIPNSLVQIQVKQLGESVHIDIMDQGTGVDLKQQSNLFEPFHTTATNGTGLGLYLSKTLCEANHARLCYIPQPQGACFRIECVTGNPN